jgi:hypothetical protein
VERVVNLGSLCLYGHGGRKDTDPGAPSCVTALARVSVAKMMALHSIGIMKFLKKKEEEPLVVVSLFKKRY